MPCSLTNLWQKFLRIGIQPVKGRMVLIAACFVPGFLVGLLEDHVAQFLPILLELKHLSYFTPIAGLVILWLSSFISTAIYERKEF